MPRLRQLVSPSCPAALSLTLAVAACGPSAEPRERRPEVRVADPGSSPPLLLVLPPLEAGVAPEPPKAAASSQALDAPAEAAPAAAAEPLAADPGLQIDPPVLPAIPGGAVNRDGVGTGTALPGGSPFVTTFVPPDPNGDVGPDHYVQAVNSHLLVLSKRTGAIQLGPVHLRTLFTGSGLGGGACEGTAQADPVVAHDALADRWIVTVMARRNATPSYECVAVSKSPDPLGEWHLYAFGPYTDGATSGTGSPAENDFPKIAVWPDAYFVTYNMKIAGATRGMKACAWERAQMLAGGAAREVCFQDTTLLYSGVLPADLEGLATPPSGSPAFLLGKAITAELNPRHLLQLWRFHVDWADPARSTLPVTPVEIPVSAFNAICPPGVLRDAARPSACIVQNGDNQLLDALGNTMMHRVVYRRLADGTEVIVANHTVDTGEDHPDFPGTPLGRTGVRWYELRSGAGPMATATPVVHQQGTFAPDDGSSRWMASVAMDQQGNVGLAYSVSGNVDPTLRYTGRAAPDALGRMTRAEVDLLAGLAPGAQTGSPRWGDYSALVVDPSDDCTFWFTGEYLSPAGAATTWRTRIGTFRFSSCSSTQLRVVPAAPSVTVGQPLGFTVRAEDAGGALVPTYAGTVALAAATGTVTPVETTLSGGASVGPLSATFTATGTGTITVREKVYPFRSARARVAVSGAAADRYAFSGVPASLSAGTPLSLRLFATDAQGNVDTSYAGRATVRSTDADAWLPAADPVFTSGATPPFAVTLFSAGPQTLQATEAGGPLVGQATTTVLPAAAERFLVEGLPPSFPAGSTSTLTITALDAYGNVATGYPGTPVLTSSDPRARFGPLAAGPGAGTWRVDVTLETAGTRTVTAADLALQGWATATVVPAAAATFAVTFPASVTAGATTAMTVEARDAFGNRATGYAATATLASSPPGAVFAPLPAAFVAGVWSGTATLGAAGGYTLSADSPGIHGQTSTTVTPAASARFAITFAASVSAGAATPIRVEALDASGNLATSYAGTATLASTPSGATFATLPATFVAGVWNGTVRFTTVGSYTLTADDGALHGQASASVTPATAASFAMSFPPSVAAGATTSFTVQARDAFGNLATGYAGTATLASSPAGATFATLPATFTAGAWSGTVRFTTAGTYTLTADAGAVHGQTTTTVGPGAAASFAITSPANVTAGAATPIAIQARDAFGNHATGYSGTATLASSPAGATFATLPATFTAGAWSGTVRFTAVGAYTVSADDGGIHGQATTTVAPGTAASLAIAFPASVTAGAATTITVQARDAFGNLASGHSGGLTLASNASGATFAPLPAALTAGTWSGTATLTVARLQVLSADAAGLHGETSTTVQATDASTLVFTGLPAGAVAGVPTAFGVEARDRFGNLATGHARTASLTSTDPLAVHPSSATFAAGVAVGPLEVTFATAGAQALTAVDATDATVRGSAHLDVQPAGLAGFAFDALPAAATAGVPVVFTLRAVDALGNLVAAYAGSAALEATGSAGVIPATLSFAGGVGVEPAAVTFTAAGAQSVTAADSAVPTVRSTATTFVTPAAAASLAVLGLPPTVAAGVPTAFSVEARDAFGNLATSYGGTAALSATGGAALDAPTASFLAGVSGGHSATFTSVGAQTVTALDLGPPRLEGAASTNVGPGAADHFVFTGLPETVVAGALVTFGLQAVDAYGNVDGQYRGTASFTSSDPQATLPAPRPLVEGVAADLPITFRTAGPQWIRATDAANPMMATTALVSRPGVPMAWISGPLEQATVRGQTTVSAEALAAKGATILDVHLLVDGAEVHVGSGGAFRWTWDTTSVANGPHVLAARAHDSADGEATSRAVTVLVANDAGAEAGAADGGGCGCGAGGGLEALGLAAALLALRGRARRGEPRPRS